MMDRVNNLEKIQNEARELFRKKNQDYGDAFANYGSIGVLVRIGDKISRLQSISNRNISLINSESLRDTLIDLHNYSAMAIMLLDESSEKSTKEPIQEPTQEPTQEPKQEYKEKIKYPTPITSTENSPNNKKQYTITRSTSAPSITHKMVSKHIIASISIEDLV